MSSKGTTTRPHELRCRYASKRCENPRAIKKNGEMHRLCEYHRERANLNQKKTDQRKKVGARRSESDDAGVGDEEQDEQLRLQDESEYSKLGADREYDIEEKNAGQQDDDDDEFDVAALDISQLDPDELDDKEIEELQALVVAEQLQQITETSAQRIDPSP